MTKPVHFCMFGTFLLSCSMVKVKNDPEEKWYQFVRGLRYALLVTALIKKWEKLSLSGRLI
jgi:hypothetical protein